MYVGPSWGGGGGIHRKGTKALLLLPRGGQAQPGSSSCLPPSLPAWFQQCYVCDSVASLLQRVMEAYDATRLVYSRVQLLEPDRASKIMGVLLLQEEGEQQILRLATGPDSMLQAAVAKAKSQLCLASGGGGGVGSSCFSGGVFPNDHFYPETFAFLNSSKARAAETSGAGWQWPSSSAAQQQEQDGGGGGFSMERLEAELTELLCGRRGPVSIAALPQLYYEAFGRPLQADGYLTESQRHGKSGHNLTRLLSRLKGNTITLLDRPHGQHAVVLTQDAHKLAAGDQYDLSGVNPSSRQIYLTFPADSAFSEDDVNIHFRAYGPVQDVRIPYQQQRMFGFVTFVYPETVRIVLSEGNPHYICGARVLVKPYRERGKLHDRKHNSAAAGESSSQHEGESWPMESYGTCGAYDLTDESAALFKLLDGTQFPSLGESHHSLSNKAQHDEAHGRRWDAATVAPSS